MVLEGKGNRAADAGASYETLNREVLAAVPLAAARILDVGCGTGELGKALKARQSCHITGITYSATEATRARSVLDRVLEVDLECFGGIDGEPFDVLVLSHVLEHIRSPEALLVRILEVASPGATVVVALPNVLWWRQRLEFARGRFRYENQGLMDRTHVHFFDHESAIGLLTDAGLEVERVIPSGGFPGSRFLGAIGAKLNRMALAAAPGLFGVEFLFVCRVGGR